MAQNRVEFGALRGVLDAVFVVKRVPFGGKRGAADAEILCEEFVNVGVAREFFFGVEPVEFLGERDFFVP